MPYLGVMTKKTFLRLKKTNPKLLLCHGCRRELQEGDDVCWACGASRKRYGRRCADRYNVGYDIPATYAVERAEWDKGRPEGTPAGGIQCIVPTTSQDSTPYIGGSPEAEPI